MQHDKQHQMKVYSTMKAFISLSVDVQLTWLEPKQCWNRRRWVHYLLLLVKYCIIWCFLICCLDYRLVGVCNNFSRYLILCQLLVAILSNNYCQEFSDDFKQIASYHNLKNNNYCFGLIKISLLLSDVCEMLRIVFNEWMLY